MTVDWTNWKAYFCNVNSKPASILVDLGLRNVAPMVTKPWLLWTWVYFQTPRPDGLSHDKEAPTLYKIEDALYPLLSEACGAIPCGRITTEGRREFYLYAETDDGFAQAVESALSGFEGYKFDVGKKKDPRWQQYLNVLYPPPESLESIKNMDVLDLFARQGDVHSVSRAVQHWLYFPSKDSRALFRHAASAAGFKIASEKRTDGELPFMISVIRVQPIDQESIDSTSIELMNLAQRFQGEYDGWEAPVITQ